MRINGKARDARLRLVDAAEEAAWTVGEHASDGARAALWRVNRAAQPLHRLIQTRLAWPLADRLEDYGTATRTAITTTAVVAALGAAIAGASVGAPDSDPAGDPAATIATAPGAPAEPSSLAGVAPDFEQSAAPADGEGASETAVAAEAVPAAPKAPSADAPEPAKVAWDFARAFVRYEVGKADEQTAKTFAAVAEKPLAEALSGDPPRLPESAEVPKAEVLNVVLGPREGKEIEVSISLLRLKAASELRLTLHETPKGWRVVEVRG